MAEPFEETNTRIAKETRQGGVFDATQGAAADLREGAVRKVDEVGESARQGLERGKREVAGRLRRLSASLQTASERMPEEDRQVAAYADKLRGGLDRAARYVESTDLDGAVRDIENFARRKPAVFFGGAVAAGLAVARLLKSGGRRSRPTRDERPEMPRSRREDISTSPTVDVGDPWRRP